MKDMKALVTYESDNVDSECLSALTKALIDMGIRFSIKVDSNHSEITFYDAPDTELNLKDKK